MLRSRACVIPLVSVALWSLLVLIWYALNRDREDSIAILSLIIFASLSLLAALSLSRVLRRHSGR
jgi:hypothetical protein